MNTYTIRIPPLESHPPGDGRLHSLQVIRLYRLIRRIRYDDALLWRLHQHIYRLEYLHPLRGYPYYKLIDGVTPVGVVSIHTPGKLAALQQALAQELPRFGCSADHAQLIIFGALTPLEASKRRIPPLLEAKFFASSTEQAV